MRWLSILSLVFIASPVVAQCSPGAGDRAASVVRQQQAQLLKVQVEEMATEVPPALQSQILHFKDALVSAADAGIGCSAAGEDAAAMQSRLAMLLGANQREKPFKRSDGPGNVPVAGSYGSGLTVAVSAPANEPQMRAVQLSFGIECGDDSILLLYQPGPQGWRRILRWQSPQYAEISGAFGDFFVDTILPGDGPGGLRVAVAHGTPWCSSRFSGFQVDVLAPAANGAARVIWHTGRGYSRGDFATRLRATDDGFELRLNAPAIDLDSGFERTVIYRYKVVGDQVMRVAPIATNGRGFVEEWMSMPWEEAKGQIAPEAVGGLKIVHDRLEKSDKDFKTYISYTYGPVRGCTVQGRYEVEMDASPGGPQFYAIQEGQNGYTMVNYETTQDERCAGKDLMKR